MLRARGRAHSPPNSPPNRVIKSRTPLFNVMNPRKIICRTVGDMLTLELVAPDTPRCRGVNRTHAVNLPPVSSFDSMMLDFQGLRFPPSPSSSFNLPGEDTLPPVSSFDPFKSAQFAEQIPPVLPFDPMQDLQGSQLSALAAADAKGTEKRVTLDYASFTLLKYTLSRYRSVEDMRDSRLPLPTPCLREDCKHTPGVKYTQEQADFLRYLRVDLKNSWVNVAAIFSLRFPDLDRKSSLSHSCRRYSDVLIPSVTDDWKLNLEHLARAFPVLAKSQHKDFEAYKSFPTSMIEKHPERLQTYEWAHPWHKSRAKNVLVADSVEDREGRLSEAGQWRKIIVLVEAVREFEERQSRL